MGNLHATNSNDPINIVLQLPKSSRNNVEDLTKIALLNQQKNMVPLSTVATFQQNLRDKPIFTRDQHPVVYVTGEILNSSPVNAVVTATQKLNNLKLADGSRLKIDDLGFVAAQPNDVEYTQLFYAMCNLTQ